MATYQITKLNQRHQQIIRLMLMGTYTKIQIARLTGFEPNSINLITNSPLFQAELVRRQTELQESENEEIISGMGIARTNLENAAAHAVAKLDDLAHSSADESIQLRAADAIMKQAFGSNSNNAPQVGQVLVFDMSKLAFLQEVAKEAGLIEGDKREPVATDVVEPVKATATAGGVEQDQGDGASELVLLR